MSEYLMPWDDGSCDQVERVIAVIEPKYTMLILSILILEGPHFFGALRRALAPVSAKVLSKRLHALEQQQLINRTVLDGRVIRTRYTITPLGAGFYDVMKSMRDWGKQISQAPGDS